MRASDGASLRYHKILVKCSLDSAIDDVAGDQPEIELGVPANRCSLAGPDVLEPLLVGKQWNYF